MRLLFPIAMTLLLAGCGSDDFTCSSNTVLETVGNIARQQLANNPMMVIMDVANSGVRIDNIRQQGGNGHALNCAATIGFTGLRPLPKAVNNPMTGEPWTKGMLDALLRGDGNNTDATYTVEKLDKGGFYVTLSGL